MPHPLPTVPSELLRVALVDLELAEKDPRYIIDMYDWHTPMLSSGGGGHYTAPCSVCLAGAVMAFGLGTDPECKVDPSNFGAGDESKLAALNMFRTGKVGYGLAVLGYFKRPEGFPDTVKIARYEEEPDLCKQQLRELADALQAVGY